MKIEKVKLYSDCICGHTIFDHYSNKYNNECIHRMGRYTGKKCKCLGYTSDNLIYLEKQYESKQPRLQ